MSQASNPSRLDLWKLFGGGVTDKYRHEGDRPVDARGYPVVNAGAGTILKDPDALEKTRYQATFDCLVFDLSNVEELNAFKQVMDRIINRKCRRGRRIDLPQPNGTLKVYLEWAEIDAVIPEGMILHRPGTPSAQASENVPGNPN